MNQENIILIAQEKRHPEMLAMSRIKSGFGK